MHMHTSMIFTSRDTNHDIIISIIICFQKSIFSGRGGRGRGRGGLGPGGPGMPPMFGGLPPFVPGDFRTPPFPGMEGFMPPPGLPQFPQGFPPHFGPTGFPPGIFPPGFPGPDIRGGRGGFNRGGRGMPPGFPPRGFPPPILGGRGGRGGRGGTRFQHPSKEKEMKGEDESKAENPLLTAIEDTVTENEAAEGTPKENECKSVANEDVSPDPVAGAEE